VLVSDEMLVAFVAELEGGALRLRLSPSGKVQLAPSARVTAEARHHAAACAPFVRRLLTLWGDAAGSLLLRTLWHPAPLPAAPFSIGPGRTVTDAAAWLARLRTDALGGPTGARARYGALQADLATLILLP